ncbi:hypothetical protein ACGFZR_06620 [Streptomyces sp. NPDC048241]|uniref:hypothetical protein n=1 Tax=Streptomyces sp. NPDC048241 TaxID=3365521 RepID=UPI003713BDB3
MTNDADAHPVRIADYHDGPFGLSPELLDERLFWMGHLYSCAEGGAGELMFGRGYAWADHRAYQQRLWQRADWPVFTIPLPAGHHLHVVYRAVPDEAGVDYLVNHPNWERAAVDLTTVRDVKERELATTRPNRCSRASPPARPV